MIEGITGLPGSGKTLYAVSMMRAAARSGRKVLANFPCRSSRWSFATWQEMRDTENALCVIDEAQMWFGSRAWKGQTHDEMAVFQQSRKNGLDLIWIAQHESRVDVFIRELTAYVTKCTNMGMLFMGYRYDPLDSKMKGKRFVKLLPKHLFWEYPSEFIIGGRDLTRAEALANFGRSALYQGGRQHANLIRLESPDFGRVAYLRPDDPAVGQFLNVESNIVPLYKCPSGWIYTIDRGEVVYPDGFAHQLARLINFR